MQVKTQFKTELETLKTQELKVSDIKELEKKLDKKEAGQHA